jgi:hypothetical protein
VVVGLGAGGSVAPAAPALREAMMAPREAAV